MDQISDGIIHQGKFEKYFHLFQKKILPLLHSRKTIDELLSTKSQSAQLNFFDSKWNTLKWRMSFKIFFSKYVMGKLGRDPKFLKEVALSVSDFILSQSKTHLSSTACQDNYFLEYILTGNSKNHFLIMHAKKIF